MTIRIEERVRTGRGALARCADDPDAFLAEVWGRRALVATAHDGGGFDDLLSIDDVDRFLTTTAIRIPFFRLVRSGERIAETDYTRAGRTGSRDVSGIADPARVAALFEDGATIVLQGLHRWSEPVARFCRDLELDLGHPCQVNAYITPPGAQGLDLHEDAHDVFVLQAFGRKRWEVHAAPREASRDPIDATVGPGDTVYMPAGTPHAARAQDELSGHLTVGVHVTPWREVLAGLVGEVLSSDDETVPAGWHDDAARSGEDLRVRLDRLADRLRDADAVEASERRRERFLSNRPPLARGWVAERAAPIRIDDDSVVRRRAGSLCRLRTRDGILVAMLGDRRLEMPPWLEPAMHVVASLADGEPLVVGDLGTDVPSASARAVLVRRLIREGLLTARGG